jgi:hypothetical protein
MKTLYDREIALTNSHIKLLQRQLDHLTAKRDGDDGLTSAHDDGLTSAQRNGLQNMMRDGAASAALGLRE